MERGSGYWSIFVAFRICPTTCRRSRKSVCQGYLVAASLIDLVNVMFVKLKEKKKDREKEGRKEQTNEIYNERRKKENLVAKQV